MGPPRLRSIRSHLLSVAIPLVLAGAATLPVSSRSAQVVVLAALLAALGGTGASLAGWAVPELEPLARAVFAFVFAVGVAVVPATWLGQAGLLRPAQFLLWAALAYALSRLVPVPAASPEADFVAPPEFVGSEIPAWPGRLEGVLLGAAVGAIALAGAIDLGTLLYWPAGFHSFDDTSYHLSTVAAWIRAGDLRMLQFPMGDPATCYYPILGEMASWVLIAPFRDSDVLARWSELPFALFSFLAVAALARFLGLRPRQAALAAVAYTGIHRVFPILAAGAGNDHSTSFFFLAALLGGLAFVRRPSGGTACATGLALGLLLATKYLGVLFAPLLLAVILIGRLLASQRVEAAVARPAPKRLLGLYALLALTMAIAGGYTYLRNAVTTGNPLFPAPLRLFGVEVLHGWDNVLASERARTAESEIDGWRFLTGRPDLLGWLFPFTLLPAALLAPLLASLRRRWLEGAVFTLPTLLFLEFLTLVADHRDIRYLLPALALAALALAWLLAGEGRISLAARLLLTSGLVAQTLWHLEWPLGRSMVGLALLLLSGALLELAWRRQRSEDLAVRSLRNWLRRWGSLAACAVLLLCAAPLGRLVTRYQTEKLERRGALMALRDLTGPGGATVAYAGRNQPYLFFGGRFENDLHLVPRNAGPAAQFYQWGREVPSLDSWGSYRKWRANLLALDIELVVLVKAEPPEPEERWVHRRSEDFALVYEDAETEIWRVSPNGGASRSLPR